MSLGLKAAASINGKCIRHFKSHLLIVRPHANADVRWFVVDKYSQATQDNVLHHSRLIA